MNRIIMAIFIGCLFTCGRLSQLQAAPEEVIYAAPSLDEVRSLVLNWTADELAANAQAANVSKEVAELWAALEEPIPSSEVLRHVVESFGLVRRDVRDFVTQCDLSAPSIRPVDIEPLLAENTTPFFQQNMLLFYARYLSERRMYEEALENFERIQPEEVVSPATYFFFKGVAEHALLKKEEGLKSLTTLLEQTEQIPTRYRNIATLLKYDLEELKEKSLDEVARMMSDVERRLSLGRGGPKVQKVEEEIIASLDLIIEKLEQQMGGGSGGGSGGQSNQSNAPAQDSVVKGSTGEGEVENKDVGNKVGWGNLPPKEEAKAKQILGNLFPPHYQKAIENFSKKSAERAVKQR